jgi:TrmH family RNA methyltransferase
MIEIRRLAKLHGTGRLRKCALLLERIELELAALPQGEAAYASLHSDAFSIARFLAQSPETEPDTAAAAVRCLDAGPAGTSGQAGAGPPVPQDIFRAIDDLRHHLMRVSGQAPADWDLHDLRPAAAAAAVPLPAARAFPDLRVYLEDIRSPFNVGTILRTAEALGLGEVLLSEACADPGHPRAKRSSMGAVDLVPWRRCPPEDLPGLGAVFALELGGTPLGQFTFPAKGVLILGSEELGVSSRALAIADAGRLSIPMKGLKASMNVAVAFGIAAYSWTTSH